MFFYLYIWWVTNDKFDAGACQELNSIDAGVCEPGWTCWGGGGQQCIQLQALFYIMTVIC